MAVPHDVVMTQNVVDRVDIAVRDSPAQLGAALHAAARLGVPPQSPLMCLIATDTRYPSDHAEREDHDARIRGHHPSRYRHRYR
jgi:hypothetical protein